MRYAGFLALLLPLVWVNWVDAHETTLGDVFFSISISDEIMETENLIISIEGTDDTLYNTNTPHYRLVLRSKETGAESAKDFPVNGGRDYSLVAFNSGYYCEEPVLFVSLRKFSPRYAGIRAYRFATHAFHRDSLQYLATAYGPFEDITPHERGVDLGFPYEMPQTFVVECSPSTEAQGFQFSITDRAEYLP